MDVRNITQEAREGKLSASLSKAKELLANTKYVHKDDMQMFHVVDGILHLNGIPYVLGEQA